MIGAWGVLYGAALAVGIPAFPGDLAWWLPAAAAVSAPGLASAWLTSRRTAPRAAW
ncbi:hypothetical protein ACFQHO_02815 [Actinomadura yumaensis]